MTASVASETASGKQAEDANAFAAEIAAILTADALPGETDGFSEEDGGAAAAFVAQTASRRAAGQPSVALESIGGEGGRRLMRLVIVNDDMPFLVDSVAAAVAARGLAVHRLLHPIVAVRRDAEGRLTGLLPARTEGERPVFAAMDI